MLAVKVKDVATNVDQWTKNCDLFIEAVYEYLTVTINCVYAKHYATHYVYTRNYIIITQF